MGSVPFFCPKAGAVGAPVVAPGLLGFRGIEPCPAVSLLTLQMGHGGLTRCRSRGCSISARSAAPGRGEDTLGLLSPLVPGSWQLSGWGEAARVPPEPLAMPRAITAPQLCPLRGCSPAPPGWGQCPNACGLLVHWPWGSLLAVGLVAMGHGAPAAPPGLPCTPPLQCWHAPAPALPGEQGPGCLKGSAR